MCSESVHGTMSQLNVLNQYVYLGENHMLIGQKAHFKSSLGERQISEAYVIPA